jgi:hypothetical protein
MLADAAVLALPLPSSNDRFAPMTSFGWNESTTLILLLLVFVSSSSSSLAAASVAI